MKLQGKNDYNNKAEMVTEAEWEHRKQFVGFGDDDQSILQELHLVARAYADKIMDELYRRWMQAEELKWFFSNKSTLSRVKALQKEYFISLTSGKYGAEYLANRLLIGRVHKRIGLSPRWYIGSYSIYMELVLPHVLSAFEYDRTKQTKAITALWKIILLDQEIALVAYFDQEKETNDGV
jgi:hypothetical protein